MIWNGKNLRRNIIWNKGVRMSEKRFIFGLCKALIILLIFFILLKIFLIVLGDNSIVFAIVFALLIEGIGVWLYE